MLAPSSNQAVSGSITIEAKAVDVSGIAGIEFFLNGASLRRQDQAPAYALTWDSTHVLNGAYTLTAVAHDSLGNSGNASIPITVNNPAQSTACDEPSGFSFAVFSGTYSGHETGLGRALVATSKSFGSRPSS